MTNVHFSSKSSEHYTPAHVLDRVVQALGAIDLDPCADPGRQVPAAVHFTKEDDGLVRPWPGRVFMNPPYGRAIGRWSGKLLEEYDAGRCTAFVALLPARTDTQWFRLYRGCAFCFVAGRLRFGDSSAGAPFPSVLVYAGPDRKKFNAAFRDLGLLVQASPRGRVSGREPRRAANLRRRDRKRHNRREQSPAKSTTCDLEDLL